MGPSQGANRTYFRSQAGSGRVGGRATHRAIIAVALALAVSGVAAADQHDSGYAGEGVDLVLYGHIYRGETAAIPDLVPMNAQPMDPQAPDLARGYSQPTVAPNYGAQFNRIHFFNTMGPVEYNASLDQPRIHPEKGLALDLLLDQDRDVLVYWYMSADALELQQLGLEPPVHAGLLPGFHLRAEMRLGNDIGDDLRAGELVAGGETMLDLVTMPPGGVTEIVVNLGKPQVDRIARQDSFNLGVTWFQLDENGMQVLMPGWNLHTGPQYPNRLVLPVKNPLYLYFVEPQFQDDGRLAVNAAFLSPLGNYDLDPASLTFDITGPGGFRAKSVSEPVFIQHSYQHNEHNVAALNGWLWDYKADDAPPGAYEVTVAGSNLQGTARVSKNATFTIEAEGTGQALDSEGAEVVTQDQLAERQAEAPKRSAGPEAAAVALALAGLALASRRRQRS